MPTPDVFHMLGEWKKAQGAFNNARKIATVKSNAFVD